MQITSDLYVTNCINSAIAFTVLAHLNLSQPRQVKREVSHEKSIGNNMENEACLVARSNEVKTKVPSSLKRNKKSIVTYSVLFDIFYNFEELHCRFQSSEFYCCSDL